MCLNNYNSIQEKTNKYKDQTVKFVCEKMRLQDEKETKSIRVVQPVFETPNCWTQQQVEERVYLNI
jgi:hypothetical protein